MMKVTLRIIALAMLGSHLFSCSSMVPLNNSYEKAATLGKSNLDFSAQFTKNDVRHFERTETSNRNYGFRVGYGISEKVDIKFR